MKIIKKTPLMGIAFLLISCFTTETKDAKKAYEYWSGNEPPKEIELLKGEYYQSPHFTLEYELFLKFKSDEKWFDKFVEYNGLEIDTIGKDWNLWTKFPEWFKPDQNYLIYAKDQTDEFEHSRYLRNPKTGISYIYETIGM